MQRLYAVDALRAFCILIVMGNHFFNPEVIPLGRSDVCLGLLAPFFKNGGMGVTGFFVVSGFLITRLLVQEGKSRCMPAREFYVRRAARLWPLLLGVMALGAMVCFFSSVQNGAINGLYGARSGEFTSGFWASILLFAYNWYYISVPLASLNGLHWNIFWSLAVEEQFYLFYPWAFQKKYDENKILRWLGFVALLGIVFRLWATLRFPLFVRLRVATPAAFDALALGAIAYLVWKRIRSDLESQPAASIILALLGFGMSIYSVWAFTDRSLDVIVGPTILALGCAVFLIGACSLPRSWDFVLKPWAWIGSLSYGLYLLHVSTYYFLRPYLPRLGSFDAGAALYFFTALVVAWFSHRYFEVPANHWFRKLFNVSQG
jgi:peptidoglycan/LPS O-acetylase OafA/YrhL